MAALCALIIVGCETSLTGSYSYAPPNRYEPSPESTEAITSPELDGVAPVEPTPLDSHPVRPVTPPTVKTSSKVTATGFKAKLVRGNPDVKEIALTFDDGPHDGYTQQLIRVLKEFNVPATFFLIGRNVEKSPELAKLALDNGFELANHTFTHTRLVSLTDEQIKQEIVKGADAIEEATGVRPTFFRPPGGEYDARVEKIAQSLGVTMVLWTADAGDFTTPFGNPTPTAIEQKVLRYINSGGIIIMHDPMPSTLQALPSLITSLRALGYTFVTVSELAQDPKAVTYGGPRIRKSHTSAVQALAEQGRYPTVSQFEETNASPEQRATNEAPSQRAAHQRTDQRSQGGKIAQGQGICIQGR